MAGVIDQIEIGQISLKRGNSCLPCIFLLFLFSGGSAAKQPRYRGSLLRLLEVPVVFVNIAICGAVNIAIGNPVDNTGGACAGPLSFQL